MTDNAWTTYNESSTIGTPGSEEGVIISDETYNNETRITLEETALAAPYTITCGIYGWLVHTRFFKNKSDAQLAYEEMKDELARIVTLIPYENDPDLGSKIQALGRELDEFINHFP